MTYDLSRPDLFPDPFVRWVQATIQAALDGRAVTEKALRLSDVTLGNADATKHGLLPKLGSDASSFLAQDGVWRQAPLGPAVRVFHSTTQSIATATITALAFDSERFDQVGGVASNQHDTVTNNTRLTCRYAGIYLILGCAQWASNPTSAQINIRLNGTTDIGRSLTNSADWQIMDDVTLYKLAVNDYVELTVRQATGGALNILNSGNYSPEFSMVRIA